MWSEFHSMTSAFDIFLIFDSYHLLTKSLILLYGAFFMTLFVMAVWLWNEILWVWFSHVIFWLLKLKTWIDWLTYSRLRAKNL